MKRLFVSLFMLSLLVLPMSGAHAVSQETEPNHGILSKAFMVHEILTTDAGDYVTSMVEALGGEVGDLDAAKYFASSDAEALLIPAGQHAENNISILFLNLIGQGRFPMVIETPSCLRNLRNAEINIYTVSGSIITFADFKMSVKTGDFAFQSFDDINNAICIAAKMSETGCIILFIIGLLIFWPVWIIWALLCF